MPLRNFGLSLSRRGARANAGMTWHPRHAVSLMVGLIAGARQSRSMTRPPRHRLHTAPIAANSPRGKIARTARVERRRVTAGRRGACAPGHQRQC
jgi:hypothetical protein